MRQVHTNTQLLAENSQKAVALRLGEDAMGRVRSEAAKARPDRLLLFSSLCANRACTPHTVGQGYAPCQVHSFTS